MKRVTVAAALTLLAASGAVGQEQRPTARILSRADGVRPQTVVADNTDPRRQEAERQKRWDERTRRATRSLCVGC